MLLSNANTSLIGRPCRVFDAAGNEVPYCVECDTDSGLCIRYATDATGKFMMSITGNEIHKVQEYRPLPLRIEWVHPSSDPPTGMKESNAEDS